MLKRFALEPSRIALNLAVIFIITLWTLPTAGLLISSLRDKNDIAASGWWTALASADRNQVGRMKGKADQVEKDGKFVISGTLFEGQDAVSGKVSAFGAKVQAPGANPAGSSVDLENGQTEVNPTFH